MRSLLKNGFSGTTMAGIAWSAGVSTATLYRRFTTLEEPVAGSVHGGTRVTDTGSLERDLGEHLIALASELGGKYGQLFRRWSTPATAIPRCGRRDVGITALERL